MIIFLAEDIKNMENFYSDIAKYDIENDVFKIKVVMLAIAAAVIVILIFIISLCVQKMIVKPITKLT